MKSFTVPAADAELRYHDIAGDGPALLFIHGLGCASSCDYPRVAADAALRGRRVLLVDLLGSGFSDRPTGFGYTIEDHARSIVALAEHARLTELDLFGHSMGGAVAITAARMLAGRLRRLVLGEPNLEPGGGFFSRRIAAMAERDYIERGHDALVQASRAEGNGVWAASLAISAPYAAHRGASSLVAGSTPSWREMLADLPQPRCVLFGEASLPSSDAEDLPRLGVDVAIIPSAGHSMAWENPAGLAQAIALALS
ncbi:alpha/beta fold hydrolase [Bosea psychrotolerans]|uniref:Pimeloyl-ACP methyl ester carboxylesterase n=1 Tax=Bosea psychrotolerans TaxID=1871628 RepID=A0A2S4LSR0_9HYPH|nr:alpha/beta hydrolase [Bosea psychrotolerans]POR45487.1 pimeloyl-ACP methyl ester carboxylesterase [Bosea psychrotolerans]